MSTLVTFIERAANLLAGVDGWHWKQLLASQWMATDGAELKVLIPKLPVAHNGYIELYRNHELEVFQYEPDKSGEVAATKLKPFRGTLTADVENFRFEHRPNTASRQSRAPGERAGNDAEGRPAPRPNPKSVP